MGSAGEVARNCSCTPVRRIRRIGDVALVAPAEVDGCDWSEEEEEVDKMREMTPSTSSRLAARISSAWAQKMGGVRPFDHASWLPRRARMSDSLLPPMMPEEEPTNSLVPTALNVGEALRALETVRLGRELTRARANDGVA